MSGALAVGYLWLKALHIIAVIAWMAGLLYLPRLFVYHADVPADSNRAKMLETMERRLLHGIMLPAVIMVFVFGGLLAAIPGVIDWHQGWIWAKLGLVMVLAGFHFCLARWHRGFALSANRHGARFYRVVNESPTIVMIAIVVLVVLKPF